MHKDRKSDFTNTIIRRNATTYRSFFISELNPFVRRDGKKIKPKVQPQQNVTVVRIATQNKLYLSSETGYKTTKDFMLGIYILVESQAFALYILTSSFSEIVLCCLPCYCSVTPNVLNPVPKFFVYHICFHLLLHIMTSKT